MRSPLSSLRLEPGGDLSLVAQLRGRIALLIADGHLRPGDALPSVRTLAHQLEVSINTVRAAYARLEADGVVRTRHGARTTVQPPSPESLSAGSTRMGTNVIGVLIAGLDPFYLDLLRGIEEVADRHGLLVLLADSHDSAARAALTIRRLLGRGVDGLIAVSVGGLDGDPARRRANAGPGATAAPAVRRSPPIVYVDQPDRSGHSLVFDGERGGYLATRHLVEHGHQRIAMVTAPVDWPNVARLHAGYLRALADAGLPSGPVIEAPGFRLDDGRATITRLLDGAHPSAVFAAGSQLALGVIDSAREAGVRVPEDLAVVGYTDSEAARLIAPPLTTIGVPARQIGVAAMETLWRLVCGETVPSERVTLGVELMLRASCGSH